MGTTHISNSEFLQRLFPELPSDETNWITTFATNPNQSDGSCWAGRAVNRECQDNPESNAYFSIATFKKIDGVVHRRKDYFSAIHVIVLDDAKDCDLDPTYCLQTSEDKFQLGFKLDKPLTDLGIANRLHEELGVGGRIPADRSGNNAVRYVRLPVGRNTKYSPPYQCNLIHLYPDVSYSLEELIVSFGLDEKYILRGDQSSKKSTPEQHGGEISNGGRNETLASLAGTMRKRGMSRDAITVALLAENQAKCSPPLDDEEVRRIADSISRYEPDMPIEAINDGIDMVGADHILSNLIRHNPTEDNVALVFVKVLGDRLRYAHHFGSWFDWDGHRWKRVETGIASHFARGIARKANNEGKSGIASSRFTLGVERLAKNDPAIAITGKEFDSDNYLLNTPRGTIDLRTNVINPHDRADLITKITLVGPSEEGKELFLKFLSEVTGGDQELQEYLQVSLGACLSGAVEAHWLLFWIGVGRNGKNTLGDLVMDVMGDYAVKVSSSLLMSRKQEQHPTELAQLYGVRLAVASEISTGEHWHEARIKEITGDSTINARYTHQDHFNFKRTHKHLIYGNNRPQLRTIDPAIKARICIVPFNQSFAGREDRTLPERLRKESAGYVLQWLCEGHKKWVELGRGLPKCKVVEDEAKDYFDSQSTIEMWLSERCREVPVGCRPASSFPQAAILYKDYSEWKNDRGEQPQSQSVWGEQMGKKFQKTISGGKRYLGVELLPSGSPPFPPR